MPDIITPPRGGAFTQTYLGTVMNVFHVAASSAALTIGLLLASALMAEGGHPPAAYAQMNRHLYVPRAHHVDATQADVTSGLSSPQVLSGRLKPVVPVAQMNRHLYQKR